MEEVFESFVELAAVSKPTLARRASEGFETVLLY